MSRHRMHHLTYQGVDFDGECCRGTHLVEEVLLVRLELSLENGDLSILHKQEEECRNSLSTLITLILRDLHTFVQRAFRSLITSGIKRSQKLSLKTLFMFTEVRDSVSKKNS